CAISQYSLFISIPINFLFNLFATKVVVPEPFIGSSTISPSFEKQFTKSSTNLSGYVAGWRSFVRFPSEDEWEYFQIVPLHLVGFCIFLDIVIVLPLVNL